MALGPNALTSWERVRDVLRFPDDQQAGVEFLIDAVSVQANRIARRKLRARICADLTLAGSGTETLILPEYPVVEIRHLWIDSSRAFGPESEVLVTDYQVKPEDGIVWLYAGRFVLGLGTVKLDATLGYESVPEDLELAVLECVSWNRRRIESGTVGMRMSAVDGSVSNQYELTIPTTAREVFESYRSGRV